MYVGDTTGFRTAKKLKCEVESHEKPHVLLLCKVAILKCLTQFF